jgi:hypothetical protein
MDEQIAISSACVTFFDAGQNDSTPGALLPYLESNIKFNILLYPRYLLRTPLASLMQNY